MMVRRRALCLLDLQFEACRARGLREVVRQSGRLQSECLVAAAVAPLLRAAWRRPAPWQMDL
eukprot:374094-Lingulodinium_polyedra.AAC.1